MPNITNSSELSIALMNIATDVIEEVSKDVADNDSLEPGESSGFLQQMLWLKTYSYEYYPNKMYYNNTKNATFQFYRAFRWKKIERGLNEVKRELFYDWQSMRFDPDTFLHADSSGTDMREQLADILNVSGEAGRKQRQPFWDITIEEFFNRGAFKGLFDAALNKYL